MTESCRDDENVSHFERYLVYKAWRDVVKIGKLRMVERNL